MAERLLVPRIQNLHTSCAWICKLFAFVSLNNVNSSYSPHCLVCQTNLIFNWGPAHLCVCLTLTKKSRRKLISDFFFGIHSNGISGEHAWQKRLCALCTSERFVGTFEAKSQPAGRKSVKAEHQHNLLMKYVAMLGRPPLGRFYWERFYQRANNRIFDSWTSMVNAPAGDWLSG